LKCPYCESDDYTADDYPVELKKGWLRARQCNACGKLFRSNGYPISDVEFAEMKQ
jgi:transcriptional regulator NrdR family protein